MDSKWAAVLVSCSDNCFLLRLLFLTQEIFDFRGGCPGAPALGNRVSFESVWASFFEHVFEAFFLLNIKILDENRLQNGARMRSCWTKFSEKMWKTKMIGLRRRVRIACEPISKSTWCANKIIKKQMCFKYAICSSKIQECLENNLPHVSKWVRVFRGWRLLGHPWRHYSKHVPKSAPKVVPRLQKYIQKGSQSAKSESQMLENSRKWHCFGSWPGGLREALTIIMPALMYVR